MNNEKLRELAQDFLRKNPLASHSLIEAYLLTLPGEKPTEEEARAAVQAIFPSKAKPRLSHSDLRMIAGEFLRKNPTATQATVETYLRTLPDYAPPDSRTAQLAAEQAMYQHGVNTGRIKHPEPPAPPSPPANTVAISPAVLAAIKRPAPKPVRLRREPIDPRFIPDDLAHWRACGPWYRVYGVEGIAVNRFGHMLRYGPAGVKRITLGPIAPSFTRKHHTIFRVWHNGKRRDLSLEVVLKGVPRGTNDYAGLDGVDLENASNDAGFND